MRLEASAPHTRVMTEQDVASGVRLNTLAGWNQTESDWRRFLENSPAGCFVTEVGDRCVGTIATICYENRFSWIGMVLVDPEFRGAGIGTHLLHKAIEHLDRINVSAIKLDATPLGKPIYLKLGFNPEYEVERWILRRPAVVGSSKSTGSCVISHEMLMAKICELDRELFGADRSSLLHSLHKESPELASAASKDGFLLGYALGRRGLFADHLGPWVATDCEVAQQLLQSFLQHSPRENVIVDYLPSNGAALDMLKAAGFAYSRPLTRMVRGQNLHPGKPESICAILGPEFG
jgi:GNAT superfamily N-acetyltransferase